jgi:ABC-type phosphate transport system substrate-binding protein
MIRTKKALGVVGATAAACTLLSGTASADIAARSGDVVGIGSDTVQNLMTFVADGDYNANPGYNTGGNKNRVFSFDATPDANDRAGYLPNTTTLNPTLILRGGMNPVQRPNGSGSGITALLKDTGSSANIQFVRASRLPSASEITTATAPGGIGNIHVVRVAFDGLQVAAASTSNAPAGLSAQQLVAIYKCDPAARAWNQVGGTSANNIIPIIPQTGSGTRSSFLADLQAANGGTAITLGSCVVTGEENDPAAIATAASPADAIAPFSSGRKALYDSGYFKDPSKKYGETPVSLTSGLQLLTGTPSDTNAVYNNVRGLYIIFRDADYTASGSMQPGGSRNWVQELFLAASGSVLKPYINTSGGKNLVAASGAYTIDPRDGTTAAYKDCGINATTC